MLHIFWRLRFHWAANRRELGNILRCIVIYDQNGDEPDAEDMEYIDRIIADFTGERIGFAEFKQQYNQRFEDQWGILWCGQFEDLMTSRDEDPRSVRESFWYERAQAANPEGDIDESDDKAIPAELAGEFIEFLGEWA